MLEARLQHATTLKKLLDAIKDLVTDVNLDCNDSGIALQSMDSSHVCMIALLLRQNGFEHYRCDRSLNLGLSITSLGKIMRSVGNDDVLVLKADDKGDVLNLMFESKNNDRISSYDLKLMDIDAEHLSVPDQEYDANILLSSAEFKRIVTDLSALSETVTITITKDGISFSVEGELANGSINLKAGGGSIDEEEEDSGVVIQMSQATSCILSLKYLQNFTKATPLASRVHLGLSSDVPALIEYKVENVGYIQYYLAPKMDEDE